MQVQKWLDSDAMAKASLAVIAFFALVASSFIAIPLEPVPITMQTLAVTLTGVVLGARFGSLVVAIWVLVGFFGFPVLAMGSGGIEQLSDPTAGYLYSFPLVAFVAGRLEKNRSNTQTFFALLIAHLLCLMMGSIWLAMYLGWFDAFFFGFVPFLAGAVLKSLLGTLILFAWVRGPRVEAQ